MKVSSCRHGARSHGSYFTPRTTKHASHEWREMSFRTRSVYAVFTKRAVNVAINPGLKLKWNLVKMILFPMGFSLYFDDLQPSMFTPYCSIATRKLQNRNGFMLTLFQGWVNLPCPVYLHKKWMNAFDLDPARFYGIFFILHLCALQVITLESVGW